ncbi:hypothetical protein [Mesorhizobium sp. B2-6-1]|uniref:hypothetical protein n=1 Tax=Mesorhizobium sp. B2-6-1 TaxID=2589916 RepID=UPI001126753F|nr:hypothetical protein [Mesorhizobium sp. B2-6-1]TPJ59961.1 hypothetical protein FJ443_22475 [Mesorhizobium sp. B2-6-1]
MSKPRTIKGKGWLNGQYQCGWQDDGKSFEEILKLDKFKATGGSRAVRREQSMKALLHWMRGQIRSQKCNWSLYNTLKEDICARIKAGHAVKDVKASVDAAIAAGAGARELASWQKTEDRLRRRIEAAEVRLQEANDTRRSIPDRQAAKSSRGEMRRELHEIIEDASEIHEDH